MGGHRTPDPVVMIHVLYQLSYRAMKASLRIMRFETASGAPNAPF